MENHYYVTPEQYKEAEKNNIPALTVYNRVYIENWSIQRAITQPVGKKSKPLWPEWREVAEQHGVKHHTFLRRVKVGKMTPEQAATTPVKSSAEVIKENAKKRTDRVLTSEQIRRAEKNGISYRSLYRRHVEEGMDIEKAITTPIIPPDEAMAIARSKRKPDDYFRRSINGFWNERKQRALASK